MKRRLVLLMITILAITGVFAVYATGGGTCASAHSDPCQ